MKPNIDITPSFHGYLSPVDLLSWEGKLFIVLLDKTNDGIVFSIECEDFEFSLKLVNNEFILNRQGIKVSIPCIDNKMIVDISWSTKHIDLSVNGKLTKQETSYTVPPAKLIKYALEKNFVPSYQFESVGKFREAVHEQISRIKNTIAKDGLYGMFWNMGGTKKNKIREPRIEIYNHTPIYALLKQWADLHSIEIIPEAKNAAGSMDFCLIGSVVGLGNVPICIEIKHAHSDDIERGLKLQLPEYMQKKALSLEFI